MSIAMPRTLHDRWFEAAQRIYPDLRDKSEANGDAPDEVLSVPNEIALRAWAEVLNLDFTASLTAREPHAEYIEQFPIEFARQHHVLALAKQTAEVESIDVAIAGIKSWQVLDVIGRFLGVTVNPILAPEEEILKALNAAYQQQTGQARSLVEDMDQGQALDELTRTPAREDLLESTGRPPVVNLVNSILFEAVRAQASDIHIQPREEHVVVRERVDGILFDTLTIPKEYQDEVISRLKVLGRMNIAEKRLPQDGRATVQVGDRVIDLRIASLPTSFGERVVVRFLDKSARLYTLEELGMDPVTLMKFRRLIKLEHGILLVTGPTGGGKSTTLYATLQEIDS